MDVDMPLAEEGNQTSSFCFVLTHSLFQEIYPAHLRALSVSMPVLASIHP
jgi:hypothetical protein